jgi:hypothetical protein
LSFAVPGFRTGDVEIQLAGSKCALSGAGAANGAIADRDIPTCEIEVSARPA